MLFFGWKSSTYMSFFLPTLFFYLKDNHFWIPPKVLHYEIPNFFAGNLGLNFSADSKFFDHLFLSVFSSCPYVEWLSDAVACVPIVPIRLTSLHKCFTSNPTNQKLFWLVQWIQTLRVNWWQFCWRGDPTLCGLCAAVCPTECLVSSRLTVEGAPTSFTSPGRTASKPFVFVFARHCTKSIKYSRKQSTYRF